MTLKHKKNFTLISLFLAFLIIGYQSISTTEAIEVTTNKKVYFMNSSTSEDVIPNVNNSINFVINNIDNATNRRFRAMFDISCENYHPFLLGVHRFQTEDHPDKDIIRNLFVDIITGENNLHLLVKVGNIDDPILFPTSSRYRLRAFSYRLRRVYIYNSEINKIYHVNSNMSSQEKIDFFRTILDESELQNVSTPTPQRVSGPVPQRVAGPAVQRVTTNKKIFFMNDTPAFVIPNRNNSKSVTINEIREISYQPSVVYVGIETDAGQGSDCDIELQLHYFSSTSERVNKDRLLALFFNLVSGDNNLHLIIKVSNLNDSFEEISGTYFVEEYAIYNSKTNEIDYWGNRNTLAKINQLELILEAANRQQTSTVSLSSSFEIEGVRFQMIPATTQELGRSRLSVTLEERDDPLSSPQHEPRRLFTMLGGIYAPTTEITHKLYQAVTGEAAPRCDANNSSCENLPVNWITFEEAESFCQSLTEWAIERNIIPDNYYFSLPTEDHWEYTARAGTNTPIAVPQNPTNRNRRPLAFRLNEYGWYQSHRQGSLPGPYPVAQLQANPWGFYDFHGNVPEWVYPSPKLPVPSNGSNIVRGGGWTTDARGCRSSQRDIIASRGQRYDIGFRCFAYPRVPSLSNRDRQTLLNGSASRKISKIEELVSESPKGMDWIIAQLVLPNTSVDSISGIHEVDGATEEEKRELINLFTETKEELLNLLRRANREDLVQAVLLTVE